MEYKGNNSSSGLFWELKSTALERWSRCEASSKDRLVEASRVGDRLGIIELVSDALLPAECAKVRGYREGKDEARAVQLLEREELTEALAWAPPSSKVFDLILARRIRYHYDRAELERCSRDCRYVEQRQPRRHHEDDDDDDDDQRAKVEALLFHANCSKAMGKAELARSSLNEAMRRINELAAKSNDPTSTKARMLQSCLLRNTRVAAIRPAATSQHSTQLLPTARPLTLPPLHGKAHKFLSCCSDALALSRDRTRGRFLYAQRNIKPGSILIVDRPFSFSTDISALHNNCTNCHLSFRLANVTQIPCKTCSTIRYCSEECSQQAWDKFHKYECQIFKYFYENDLQKCNALLAYRTVVTAFLQVEADQLMINKDFIRLHENDKDSIDVMSMKKYEPDNYETVFSLETHCIDQKLEETLENAIHSIFLARCLIYSLKQLGLKLDYSKKLENILAVSFLHNIQAIKCNAYEIVENVRNEETRVLEPRNVGGAIYTSVSLTNHSCYPNIVRHCFPAGAVVVTSLRFIPKGAEILDCYGQHFLENERNHRRRYLKMKYYFECKCEACSFDWPIKLQNNDFHFKCKRCLKQCRKLGNTVECKECGHKIGISKLYNLLQNSTEKRVAALTKMYDGCYSDALPLLLEHANFIEQILLEPSLEAIKTQQSIIQCLNAMSSVSV